MKRTLTVNLNNIVFHIDDDAYDMLQTYLHDISDHFREEDERKEIMNDVEARIAELFSEKLQKNKNVINLEDVQEVIEIMGNPSQYTDAEEEAPTAEKQEKKTSTGRARRFYRDPENAILGGVAGGLAAYFNIDVTIIRILLVVMVFVGVGFVIPVYIVMWIVAPAAVTAAQRLEMQGEDVTVESIKTELNNAKNYVQSENFKQSASKVGTGIGHAAQIVARVLLGVIGAVLGVVGVVLVGALILVLFMLVFHPAVVNGFGPEIFNNWEIVTPEKMVLMIVSLILVVGCPIFLLVYWAIRIISGRRGGARTASWVVLVLWFAGLFMFYSVGNDTFGHLKGRDGNHLSFKWDEHDSPDSSATRPVAAFTSIEVSGNIEVVLTKDSIHQLTVEAEEDYLPSIVTKVENGVLRIYANEVFLNRSARVTVPVDSLNRIECSGASKISTDTDFTSSNFLLKLSGASEATMDVKIAQQIELDLSGASKAEINGNAGAVKIECSGASHADTESLQSKTVFVKASGASHAEVYASERLDATAGGASEIDCQGSPKVINKSSNMGSDINVH